MTVIFQLTARADRKSGSSAQRDVTCQYRDCAGDTADIVVCYRESDDLRLIMGNIYSMSVTVVLERHVAPKVRPLPLLDLYRLSLYGYSSTLCLQHLYRELRIFPLPISCYP
jgi:hypothetical protein